MKRLLLALLGFGLLHAEVATKKPWWERGWQRTKEHLDWVAQEKPITKWIMQQYEAVIDPKARKEIEDKILQWFEGSEKADTGNLRLSTHGEKLVANVIGSHVQAFSADNLFNKPLEKSGKDAWLSVITQVQQGADKAYDQDSAMKDLVLEITTFARSLPVFHREGTTALKAESEVLTQQFQNRVANALNKASELKKKLDAKDPTTGRRSSLQEKLKDMKQPLQALLEFSEATITKFKNDFAKKSK